MLPRIPTSTRPLSRGMRIGGIDVLGKGMAHAPVGPGSWSIPLKNVKRSLRGLRVTHKAGQEGRQIAKTDSSQQETTRCHRQAPSHSGQGPTAEAAS